MRLSRPALAAIAFAALAREGALVNPGAVLVEMDTDALEAALDRASN